MPVALLRSFRQVGVQQHGCSSGCKDSSGQQGHFAVMPAPTLLPCTAPQSPLYRFQDHQKKIVQVCSLSCNCSAASRFRHQLRTNKHKVAFCSCLVNPPSLSAYVIAWRHTLCGQACCCCAPCLLHPCVACSVCCIHFVLHDMLPGAIALSADLQGTSQSSPGAKPSEEFSSCLP